MTGIGFGGRLGLQRVAFTPPIKDVLRAFSFHTSLHACGVYAGSKRRSTPPQRTRAPSWPGSRSARATRTSTRRRWWRALATTAPARALMLLTTALVHLASLALCLCAPASSHCLALNERNPRPPPSFLVEVNTALCL